ncbi:MAG: tetratricopeptide repeat protein [Gemmatales bacterium]|nr:tetratricopeptide repeat protein [Gemmatales bacterium]MDW8176812.1 tetratricopeptide repeat protein [Gemmatales bacterium]
MRDSLHSANQSAEPASERFADTIKPCQRFVIISALAWLGLIAESFPAYAGLYHRPVADEVLQPVPQWSRFFDTVIPKLRSYAPPDPLSGLPASALREQALKKISSLAQRPDALTADDFVDWSGWLIRLIAVNGRPTLEEARRILDRGRARYPRDYRLAAHLATVYQLSGEYDRALALTQEALESAPPAARDGERYHLRLIVQRRIQDQERRTGRLAKEEAVLDDLFGQRWWEHSPLPWPGAFGPREKPTPLPLASSPSQPPPADAGVVIQQLLIWFPFDGQLWWLLGEYLVAVGEWNHAATAFQTAGDLRLGGRVFRQRRTLVLEQAERARREAAAPILPELPSSDPAEELAQPVPLWSRFGWPAWTLLICGGAILLMLAAWQVQIWTRRLWRRCRLQSHS